MESALLAYGGLTCLTGVRTIFVCDIGLFFKEVADNNDDVVNHTWQAQLKRILSAVMQRRSSYRLRENRMRFSMGCRVDNPYRIRCTNSAESQSNRYTSVGWMRVMKTTQMLLICRCCFVCLFLILVCICWVYFGMGSLRFSFTM